MWFHVIPSVYWCFVWIHRLRYTTTSGWVYYKDAYCLLLHLFAQVYPRFGPIQISIQYLNTTTLPYNITHKTISIHRRTQHDVIIRFINVKKVKPNARAPTICCFLSSFPCGKRPPTLFFFSLFLFLLFASILNGSKRCCSAVLLNLFGRRYRGCVFIYTTAYISIYNFFFSFRIDILMRDRHTVYVSMHFIHTIDRQPRPFMYFFCGSTMSWMDIFGGWALLFSIVGGKRGREGLE